MRFCVLILCFLIMGCQTALPLPVVPVDDNQPVFTKSPRPMALAKASIDLKRGTPYIAYPYFRWSFDDLDISLLDLCNASVRQRFSNSIVEWSSGDKSFGGWNGEAEKFIAPPMRQLGYEFLTSDDSVFQQKSRKKRAELLLSATIIDIKSNLCQVFNFLYFKNADIIAGNMWMKVKWEVFDTLADRVVGTFESEGVGLVAKPTQDGNELLFLRALEDASKNLGRQHNFVRLLQGSDTLSILLAQEKKQSPLHLSVSNPKNLKPLYEQSYLAKRAVVTVGDDSSGFFIAPDGYILTTFSAVGSADKVPVIDSQGNRYIAKIIRKNERLKVALIQIPVMNHTYLTLAPEEILSPLVDVFTIGNPSDFMARSTLSRGTISAWRTDSNKDMALIQASIATTEGFGGAPLLDEYGRVLGLHDGRNQSESNFSYYISIWDILRAMKLDLKG